MTRSLFIYLLIICSCQNAPKENVAESWIVTVASLKSKEQKKEFLEEAYTELFLIRRESDASINNFGLNSKEHLKKKKIFNANRLKQFAKIDAYLNHHGYPSIMELGGKAAYAPYFVTQNMPDLKSREKNFTYLYDAYVFGNITVDLFYHYVSDLYYLKTNENYLFNPNVDTKFQIEDIMEELGYG